MPITTMSLGDLNRTSRAFWLEQQTLLKSRMDVARLRDAALSMIKSELRRGVPVRSQLSLYQALEEAHSMGVDSQMEQARKGGRAKKNDALQELILSLVQRNPRITATELESRLKVQQGLGVIDDFDDETKTFTFGRPGGRLKEAELSGLKDRLYRAKKFLRSR